MAEVGQETAGGARACSGEPARDAGWIERQLVPDHPAPGGRHGDRRSLRRVDRRPGMQHATEGAAAAAGSPARRLVVLCAPGAALPWQITAALRGSDAAMPAAQQAAIGAKICTARANRTMGRKFLSRRRIATPIQPSNNHHQSPKSRAGFPDLSRPVAMKYQRPARCIARSAIAMRFRPYPLTPRGFSADFRQPRWSRSQTFRNLLEF